MKTSSSLIAAAAALVPFAAAIAQSAPPDPGKQQGATFESLDKNGDGRISKAEAAAGANVSAQFSHYDKNGDGFIERAEVQQANGTAPDDSKPQQ